MTRKVWVFITVAALAAGVLYYLLLSDVIDTETAAWLSTAIAAVCAIYYIVSALLDTTKPEPITWSVWAVAAVLGAGSALEAGAGVAAAITFVYIVLTVTIAGISIWRWTQRRSRENEPGYYPHIFVVGLVGTIAFWAFELPPILGAAAAVVIDLIVFWPTVFEAWKDPSKEPAVVWGGDAIAATMAVMAILLTTSEVAAWLFTLYLAVAQGGITLMLIYRKQKLGLAVR